MDDAESAVAEHLWRDHGPELLRFATMLVGPSDAADVVAAAFERVTRVARQLDNPRAYLWRAVNNVAIDQGRRARRRQQRELRVAAANIQRPVESRPDVRQAIARLSVQQRAVVYFTYWHDLDSPAVAELLGIAPATVRRHLVRARDALRKDLE